MYRGEKAREDPEGIGRTARAFIPSLVANLSGPMDRMRLRSSVLDLIFRCQILG